MGRREESSASVWLRIRQRAPSCPQRRQQHLHPRANQPFMHSVCVSIDHYMSVYMYVRVYVCVNIHTIYVCACVYGCVHIFLKLRICMYVMRVWLYVCVCRTIYIYMYERMNIYIPKYILVCVCTPVLICISVHTHTHLGLAARVRSGGRRSYNPDANPQTDRDPCFSSRTFIMSAWLLKAFFRP